MSQTAVMTMANSKPEDSDNPLWQGYGLQPPAPSSAHAQPFESQFHPAPLSIPYHSRPSIPSLQTRTTLRDDNTGLPASAPPLSTHHSYPSLKRAFDAGNDMGYLDGPQDFREDVTDSQRPSISQDHRLLNFARLQDKHTLIDSAGRIKQVDLSAQIHGMFFLSELATPSTDHGVSQPELTCYRRNLFQISGSVTTPRGSLSMLSDRGERVPVVSLEVNITATESVDGHAVKLIVIPWKTPPPNSPDIPTGQEQEPATIPLPAFDDNVIEPGGNPEFAMFPIAYRRLQFRIATANNGRRRELQQHFTLHLNVIGTLANGVKINVSENSTAPIVVRGRSPRNFQARKEIPLVGSSSSRGHPPELHVATGMLTQSPTAQRSATMPKLGALDLPRAPFTFDSSTLNGSPAVRQPHYSHWTNTPTPISPDQTATSATPQTPSSYPASAISLDTYLQPSHLSPQSQSALPRSATLPLARPLQSHYSFPTPTPQTFGDSNPRPTKSPRHIAPSDLPGTTRFTSPYGTSLSATAAGDTIPPLPRGASGSEYFPSLNSMSMPQPVNMNMAHPPAWASTSNSSTGDVGTIYGGQPSLPGIAEGGPAHNAQAPPSQYDFSSAQRGQGQQQDYSKQEATNAMNGGQHYTWTNS